jgi:hypothetical protein
MAAVFHSAAEAESMMAAVCCWAVVYRSVLA